MAIGAYFQPTGLTPETYEKAMNKLEAEGHGAPKGRMYHIALDGPEGMTVFNVWNSPEELEAFFPIMMPVLSEFGIDPGQPQIMPVVGMMQG